MPRRHGLFLFPLPPRGTRLPFRSTSRGVQRPGQMGKWAEWRVVAGVRKAVAGSSTFRLLDFSTLSYERTGNVYENKEQDQNVDSPLGQPSAELGTLDSRLFNERTGNVCENKEQDQNVHPPLGQPSAELGTLESQLSTLDFSTNEPGMSMKTKHKVKMSGGKPAGPRQTCRTTNRANQRIILAAVASYLTSGVERCR